MWFDYQEVQAVSDCDGRGDTEGQLRGSLLNFEIVRYRGTLDKVEETQRISGDLPACSTVLH